MPIYRGSTEIQRLNVGGTEIKEVYVGSKKVFPPVPKAMILIQADATGDMLISNKWSTPVLVNGISVAANANITIPVQIDEIIEVKESKGNTTFRSWNNSINPLVKNVFSHIISMPAMDKFTTDIAGTKGGNYFFYSFNYNGTLTSLPEGSFDTSGISGEQGFSFFSYFNYNGALTSLPVGSFDTSGISGGQYVSFFSYFNYNGALTSLPVGSF
jgi:surface protein